MERLEKAAEEFPEDLNTAEDLSAAVTYWKKEARDEGIHDELTKIIDLEDLDKADRYFLVVDKHNKELGDGSDGCFIGDKEVVSYFVDGKMYLIINGLSLPPTTSNPEEKPGKDYLKYHLWAMAIHFKVMELSARSQADPNPLVMARKGYIAQIDEGHG